MPASPSRYVMALSQAAVDMNAGSKNQTPGRSFDHSLADTPPLTMGISIVSPFLLSVIVMLSARCRALQFLISVRLDPRTRNRWGRHEGRAAPTAPGGSGAGGDLQRHLGGRAGEERLTSGKDQLHREEIRGGRLDAQGDLGQGHRRGKKERR